MDVKHSYKIANVLIVALVELFVVEITLGNEDSHCQCVVCPSEHTLVRNVTGETCPVDWKLIDGVCFQYSHEENVTWSEAEEICTKQHNSSLIVIDSQNVYDTIREHVNYTGNTYWLGAKRDALRNGFMWIDGSHLSENNTLWHPYAERKSLDQCVQLKNDRNDTGLNDYHCAMNLSYICGSPDVTGCNEGWNKIGNACIKLFGDTDALSWHAAEASCQKLGSNLAVIGKASWPALVSLLTLSSDVWSFWIGAKLDEDGVLKWIDGSAIPDSLWLPGEPSRFEYCVQFMYSLFGSGMNDVPCSRKRGFICGFKECRQIYNCKRQTCFNTNTTVCSECEDNFQLTSDHQQCQLIQNTGGERNSYSGKTCPVAWKLIDGVCFQYSQKEYATWSEAEELCTKKHNSSLIVIDSQNVYDTITEHVYYTGNTYWIGAKRDAFRNRFMWIDGTHLSENNTLWYPYADRKSIAQCVQLIKKRNDTGLNAYFCAMNLRYICGSPDVTGCNEGWNKIGNTCIKLFGDTDALSWHEAEASCQTLGSNLAIIEKASWPALVSLLTLSSDVWSFWIGAKLDEDGVLKWTDGSAIPDSLWLPGEPNGFEYCVQFMYNLFDTGLTDESCSRKRGFICGFKVCSECEDNFQLTSDHLQCQLIQNTGGERNSYSECRKISNCKRQTCFDTNTTVCSECEDNFQLTSDHLQCQLIQNTGGERNCCSESPMFIYGWACAAILLIVLITTCVGFCLRGRQIEARRPPQSSGTQLGENTIGNNYVSGRLPQHCDDCYELPSTYIELPNQNVQEQMYNV